MQIRPNAPLPIVYVISDPTDAGTYYVRSVIRNSATGAIIQILGLNYVNLTVSPSNSRRFSKTILTPQDSSNVGFYIDVTTTVYTDASYSTVSSNYQEENIKYLVLEPWSVGLGLGGGGWGSGDAKKESSFDYDKLLKLLEILIRKIIDETPLKDLKNTDLVPVLSGIKEILGAHEKLESLPTGLNSLRSDIASRPKFEKTNLSPVLEGLQSFLASMSEMQQEIQSDIGHSITGAHGKLQELIKKHGEKSAQMLKKVIEDSGGLKFTYNVESKPVVDKFVQDNKEEATARIRDLFATT